MSYKHFNKRIPKYTEIECIETGKVYYSCREIEEEFGTCKNIHRAFHNKMGLWHNYHWICHNMPER